jgi:type III secretion protein L
MSLAFLINTDNIKLATDRKVFKAEEYALLLDAVNLLQVAEEEANRIKSQAFEAYELERQRGYEDGFTAGKEEGSKALVKIAANAQQTYINLEQKIADTIINIVAELLRKVETQTFFKQTLKRVSKAVRHEPFLTMKVNPKELASAQAAIEDYLGEAEAPGHTIEVLADTSLELGSCLLESDSGVIDTGLDVQLRAIRSALIESFKQQKILI